MESLGIDGWAGEIAEYIDRFIFRIDTKESSGEKAIKGIFLTAAGKEAFTLLKTLVYPKGTLPSQKFKTHFRVMSGLAS